MFCHRFLIFVTLCLSLVYVQVRICCYRCSLSFPSLEMQHLCGQCKRWMWQGLWKLSQRFWCDRKIFREIQYRTNMGQMSSAVTYICHIPLVVQLHAWASWWLQWYLSFIIIIIAELHGASSIWHLRFLLMKKMGKCLTLADSDCRFVFGYIIRLPIASNVRHHHERTETVYLAEL